MARITRQFQVNSDKSQGLDEEEQRKRQMGVAGGVSSGVAMPGADVGDTSAPVGQFVNFGRFFSLNEGKANKMASALAGNMENAHKGAADALKGAQGTFDSQVRRGTTQYTPGQLPPTGQQGTGTAFNGQTQTQQSEGLMSGDKPPPEAAPDVKAPAPGASGRKTPASAASWRDMLAQTARTMGREKANPGSTAPMTEAELQARANAKYTGPNSLETMAGYADAQKKAQTADEKTGQLGTDAGLQALIGDEYGALGGYATPMGGESTGKSRLDAAMAGTAGRPGFTTLQDYFGNHKAGDALTGAVTASKAQADAAKRATAEAAAKYGSDYAARQAEAAAATDAQKPITIAAAPGVGGSNAEVGWTTEMQDQLHPAQEQAGATQSLNDARSGQVNAQGYNGIAYTWSGLFGVSQAEAQGVLDAISEEDWTGYQQAASRGEQALKEWFAAMRQKYGV